MSYIGREPQIGNFQVCDAISTVNNQAAYTMQVGGVNVSPETENHMLVSLNGILQRPGSSFTVSNSVISFAANLVTGDVINFIHILGSVLDLGVPSDSTVSLAKLTATGTKNSTTFLRGDNTFAAAGGGVVLQVVSATDTTERSTTSTSFVTASNGLSVNITPSSSSNKVYVIVSTATYNSTAAKSIYLTIYKGSTNLGNAQGLIRNLVQGSAAGSSSTCAILNSPNTTSQVTYQVYLKTDSGGTALLNANTPGTITAFEIAG